jgi:transcriptional regulator with XRE-family HTH domain
MQNIAKKNTTLGNRIRTIRKSTGLDQEEFADRLGLRRKATISDYERNKKEPKITTLRNIAETGNVSLDWLLIGKAPEKQLSPLEKTPLSPKLQILLEMVSNLSDSAQNEMLETVLRLKREHEEAKQQQGLGKKKNSARKTSGDL